MTSIWLLTSGGYEFWVEEVFTDHDMAQRWLVARQRQDPHDRTIGLEEWTVRAEEPCEGTCLTLRLTRDMEPTVRERFAPVLEAYGAKSWAFDVEIGASGTDHDAVWAAFMERLPDEVRVEVQANLDAVKMIDDMKETP